MSHLARIIALAALIAAPLAARADDDPAAAQSAAEVAAQPQATPLVTPLSGVEVVARPQATPLSGVEVVARPKATPLSELDVVVRRRPATNLTGVEVTPPPTCLPPRSPADQEVPTPKLVSTYPADGQTVQPGYIVLRLTFDLPMACRGSLPLTLQAACFTGGIEIWHESFDRRSLMIVCDLKPGAHYELGINRRIPEHFQGLSGREPEAGGFSFDTSDAAPVRTAEGMVGRDAQVVAMLAAAASRAGPPGAGSEATAAARPAAANVSLVRVQETNKCLQPRDPPDPDVPAPKLVSTFPAQGQVVRPGLLEVRFTFDLPMACTVGVEVKDGSRNPCSDPDLTEHWSLPWNRRSLRVRCHVEPGKRYVLMINKARINANHTPLPKLTGLGGKVAEPYELSFWTSHDAPVRTQDEADLEDPLMAAELGNAADRER